MSPPHHSALEPLVRRLAYWAELGSVDEEAIRSLPHKTRKLERNAYIVRERDRTSHSCLIVSGFAIRLKIVASGARQIVSVHMKGDMVDLQNAFLGVADHSVQRVFL